MNVENFIKALQVDIATAHEKIINLDNTIPKEVLLNIKNQLVNRFNKLSFDDEVDKWENILSEIKPDDAIALKTGYTYFDDWQVIKKKRITCFIGKTNSGKTYSLINIAAALTRQGYKVAYLSFEVEKQDIRIRILSQLFGINYDKIKLIYDVNEIKKLWDLHCKYLKLPEIFSDSYNTYDTTRLLAELLKKEEDLGEKFDAIIIDYMSLLDSSEEQMYLKGKDISQAFARYSKSYNWAIISAAQVNRPGLIKIRLGMDDIAESAAMLHTFDFIISIIHCELLRDDNKIAWELIKARYVNNSNRPGCTTSFKINWQNGGNYKENSEGENNALILDIDNIDTTAKKKSKLTTKTKTKTYKPAAKIQVITVDTKTSELF